MTTTASRSGPDQRIAPPHAVASQNGASPTAAAEGAARIGGGQSGLAQATGRQPARRQLSFAMIAALGSSLAGLLICLLVSAILILHARAAVRQETDAAFLLATATATFRQPTAFARADLMAQAQRLASEIDRQRHVAAWVEDGDGKRILPEPAPTAAPTAPRNNAAPAYDASEVPAPLRPALDAPPDWLTRLLTPPPRSDMFPIRHYPNVLGLLRVATDPSDEIAKTWDNLRVILPLLALALAVMVAVTILVALVVTRRLAVLGRTIDRMRENDLAVRAPASQLRDLDQLAEGVNALASHLDEGRAENRRLQERMMTLAETERARIAGDLHDDMGPQLFALRAAVGQAGSAGRRLQDQATLRFADDPNGGPQTDFRTLEDALSAITRHAQEVQKSARSAIEDLRPMTLDEAGLEELLHELVLNFSEMAPEIGISITTTPIADCGEAAGIAIYRFVRESILNAIRHANPSRITIEMTTAPHTAPRPARRAAHHAAIVTRVLDDGTGPAGKARSGLGLNGIRERAQILGAAYLPPTRIDGMTVTELRIVP